MYRIGYRRIDGIGGEDQEKEDERVDPCVPKREGFPAAEETLCFPSFGEGAERLGLAAPLRFHQSCLWVQRYVVSLPGRLG